MYLEAQAPLMLTAKCRIAPPLRSIAALPHTYQPVPANIVDLISHDFQIEHIATTDAETIARETHERNARFAALAAERARRLEAKAPGFSLQLVPTKTVAANQMPAIATATTKDGDSVEETRDVDEGLAGLVLGGKDT
ncbi:hypothetical protein CcCBS67573_g04393 [Chytriomyces confervae]|uniref:Uncharacterized protein n=1 Tax=Chytriomyces confervae TaxID=246404 RepID=A0A507FDB3_9FUNG|nr:hypothetical protein HDU80_007492 [Chytriomyces hyalinus]TPX74331.1 hypothetical protein CcCBS67573_g04393 [Chytriomyces confervae]